MRLSANDRESAVWKAARGELDERGFALLPTLVQPETCAEIAAYYADERRFRSRVKMARYAFGRGEYKYFAYPLPKIIQQLRHSIYPELAPLANQWAERLGASRRYPERLSDFIEECHRAGQKRPTPLLLKYGAGDFNCLHQDLYGEIVFPFQLTVFLTQRGKDFDGGEFILCEQRPRQQSRAEALDPNRGDAVVFSVQHRPIRGIRGYYRATVRHGVSTVHSGERYTLGIIFHDAK